MSQQNPAHSLQPTALLHEAYIRLVGDHHMQLDNRAHFFAVAAKSMRHVLVDHARAKHTAKRGGEKQVNPLEEGLMSTGDSVPDIIALDDALTDLAKLNVRQSKVVELRYFGGLSVSETAETLKVSPETVMRDWRAAKAWLYRELSGSKAKGN
jgi:RNA polymerase sigma factor (TIGR02999 family)